MLLSLVRTYTLQIVQWTYMGPLDVCYFLGYHLGNTWTYKTFSGPMCKDHRTYARVAGRLLLCQRVGGKLSL
jgi:anaerobic ribonucleoside-triphosphate reductase